ncbi:plant UBX domain-containing protein 1 isoform X1 [Vitis riparia]|uniref:plant UBX domain-containing protein 1 isoform X1 n=1 Tax=Vitis riparia TaxID=96939 RepID=UPI00155B0538|nr:plant UBX domain-containing protein 1 isoform X1 [Vitis riparia]
MIFDSSPHWKRRRLTTIDPMDEVAAKAALEAVKQKFGREIHVFETSTTSQTPDEASNSEETDDFYEFTAEDYYRILATKKEDKFLKTRKIREAEEAARKSRITKVPTGPSFAVIRVRFPDNHTLEATFHPSETLQSLVDLLMKVIAQPELPFYIYTAPPKKQIKDMSQDFYSAGFVPGAIIYFSYDQPKGNDGAAGNSGACLREEIMSLKGLHLVTELVEPVRPAIEPEAEKAAPPPVAQEPKPAQKKPVKPKWLKM